MARYILLIIFVISLCNTNGWAKPSENEQYQIWIDSAEQAYSNKDYEKSIELYKRITGHGMESADLYYNLGNALYRNQQLIEAILYFEKAIKLDPSHEDAKFNLQLANSFITDRIEPIKAPFYKRWYKSLWKSLPAEKWGNISLGAFILFVMLIFLFVFTRKVTIKKLSIPIGLIVLLITILSLTFGNEARNNHLSSSHAIIFEPMLNVKSSPDESGTDLFTIHEGLKVEIKDKLGNWTEIRLADGRVGWIPKESFEKI